MLNTGSIGFLMFLISIPARHRTRAGASAYSCKRSIQSRGPTEALPNHETPTL
jgi:hypothetical protein